MNSEKNTAQESKNKTPTVNLRKSGFSDSVSRVKSRGRDRWGDKSGMCPHPIFFSEKYKLMKDVRKNKIKIFKKIYSCNLTV
jgi:hypothetical protein